MDIASASTYPILIFVRSFRSIYIKVIIDLYIINFTTETWFLLFCVFLPFLFLMIDDCL